MCKTYAQVFPERSMLSFAHGTIVACIHSIEPVRSMLAAAPPADKATPETITAMRRWTDGLVSFRTTRPAAFRFTAGQYARLGLQDENGSAIWRAYSIVSATHDPFLEYLVIDVPGGAFTGMLRQKKEGDAIWTERQPYGFMTADRFTDGEDLWLLATGTGLGPFLSILRESAVWQRFRNLIVVHSVRHARELAYADELLALGSAPPAADAAARLQVVQSTTRDPVAEDGRLHGRITTLLESGELERVVNLRLMPESSRVMLCGNPQMIDDARKILHHRGMRPVRRTLPGQFVTENYW